MNKVNITVKKQVKVDGRTNNTGRPVNKKSARQVRLAKQALYNKLHTAFINGKKFKINNNNTEYMYKRSDDNKDTGCIVNSVGMYVCNVNYIGRTKVTGFTFVLDKCVNVTINLKEVKFV
tara:strand:- start:312 stop:671 length:360 start_codon:yes stop_codon:yes gene_type:complete